MGQWYLRMLPIGIGEGIIGVHALHVRLSREYELPHLACRAGRLLRPIGGAERGRGEQQGEGENAERRFHSHARK